MLKTNKGGLAVWCFLGDGWRNGMNYNIWYNLKMSKLILPIDLQPKIERSTNGQTEGPKSRRFSSVLDVI